MYYGIMSSPITHLVLAEKVFEKYFPSKNKAEFMIGTIFPDIRRFAKIDRNSTHFESMKIGSILNESSFMAGYHFHSVVDGLMKKFRLKEEYASLFAESEYLNEVMKTFEDMVLMPKIENWDNICRVFERVMPEEMELFGTDREVVEKWHLRVQNYIKTMPDYKHSMLGYIVYDPEIVSDAVIKGVESIKDKNMAIELIERVYEEFERLLEE